MLVGNSTISLLACEAENDLKIDILSAVRHAMQEFVLSSTDRKAAERGVLMGLHLCPRRELAAAQQRSAPQGAAIFAEHLSGNGQAAASAQPLDSIRRPVTGFD